jgi:hypothetical protein
VNRRNVIEISKIIAVESAKGYVRSIALNVAALGLLALIGAIWMKIDEFRSSRKN